MATRTIVTSQPDVACDVCERRLLRGEQPDIFLVAGRRRTVCELCAPRATHEGWLRESDSQSVSLPPMRPRRGRSLFDRLRQVGTPAREVAESSSSHSEDREPEPYDFLDPHPKASAAPVPAMASGRAAPAAAPADQVAGEDLAAAPNGGASHTRAGAEEPEAAAREPGFAVQEPGSAGPEPGSAVEQSGSYLEGAIEVFNASEYPRRVAGVARSLGAPVVNVRCSEHLASVVAIVVAWELCWYRYEVDLSEGPSETRVIAQGTEPGELAREERVANAVALEGGALCLSAVQ